MNVRNYDKSCRKTMGTTIRHCVTCDPGIRLSICDICFKNGYHQDHHIITMFQFNCSNMDIYCNCGDANGLVFCENHSKTELPVEDRPLYVNNVQMNKFVALFGISQKELIPVAINCQIRPVRPGSSDAKLINTYFENSKLSSKVYIQIRSVWSVYRKHNEMSFVKNNYEKYRRMLLWHGTKTNNLLSILNNGFVLPKNKSEISNGSMFGQGVYFSDRVSKSAQYCDEEGKGIVFLCETSLGAMWREGKATNYKNVPHHFHSIKGVGKFRPDPEGDLIFDEDIIVPAGKTIPNNNPDIIYSQLNYNEYVVFDPQRILIKFIVQIEKL